MSETRDRLAGLAGGFIDPLGRLIVVSSDLAAVVPAPGLWIKGSDPRKISGAFSARIDDKSSSPDVPNPSRSSGVIGRRP